MFMIFLFFGSILAISKDNIKHLLNFTIGLCIVYPDHSNFNITKDRFYQALINSIQGPFFLSTCKYSDYSLSDRKILSEHSTNIVITRENEFLEYYQGNFSVESVSNEINQAFYSYVEILSESNISNFKKEQNSLFILTGPSIIKEFEDAAFFYRNTKARFGFLYSKSSTDSFVSLFYIKNKLNVTRMYDRKVPMIQFIRSCKSQYATKNENKNIQQFNLPKNSIQFVAISDEFTEEIQTAFDYINKSNYKGGINFDVVSWENTAELMKKCQIKKSPFFNFSFVIYSKFNKKIINNDNNIDNNCFVFQDMNFFSKELLYFFVSKTINFFVYNSDYNETKIESSQLRSSRPLTLSPSNFSKFVPGKRISFVFIESPKSFSNSRAKMIFNSICQEFYEMRLSDDGKFLNPVQFYRIQYQYDNFKLPSADSFPTFAIFKPFDKQSIVFNQILTATNLRNWIFKHASKNEELISKNVTENVVQNKLKVTKRPKIVNINRQKIINLEL